MPEPNKIECSKLEMAHLTRNESKEPEPDYIEQILEEAVNEPRENDRTMMDDLKKDPAFNLGREYERKELVLEFVEIMNQISRKLTIDDYTDSERARLNTIRKVNKEREKWEEKLK